MKEHWTRSSPVWITVLNRLWTHCFTLLTSLSVSTSKTGRNFFQLQHLMIPKFILCFLFNLLLFFYFTILYWFCHTSTWIRHGCTRVPREQTLNRKYFWPCMRVRNAFDSVSVLQIEAALCPILKESYWSHGCLVPWIKTKQDSVGLWSTDPFCFLSVGYKLHSASLIFPEFQRENSNTC